MSKTLDIGFPIRPLWTRNWFDRLLVRLHITPPHMNAWLDKEARIISLAKEVDDRCFTLGLLYSIVIEWEKEQVVFKRLERPNERLNIRPVIEIPFDMLLGESFNPKSFTEIGLSYRKP